MLKLSRHIGETVVLELPKVEQIDVVLLEVKGSQVGLALNAPLEVRIVREELLIGDDRPARDRWSRLGSPAMRSSQQECRETGAAWDWLAQVCREVARSHPHGSQARKDLLEGALNATHAAHRSRRDHASREV